MVLEAQKGEIIKVIVRWVMVEVGHLAGFLRIVAVQTEADAAATPRGSKNFG